MPNFDTLGTDLGYGAHAHNATVYLTILEEYTTRLFTWKVL